MLWGFLPNDTFKRICYNPAGPAPGGRGDVFNLTWHAEIAPNSHALQGLAASIGNHTRNKETS